MSKLLVLGNQKTISLFSFMGAIGLEVKTKEDMDYATSYLEKNQEEIGGLLIIEGMIKHSNKLIRVTSDLGIPYTSIPESNQSKKTYEIDKLLNSSFARNKRKS